jgi:hypothetical protein
LKVKQHEAVKQSLLTEDKELKALYQGKEKAFGIAVSLLREKQIEEIRTK